MSRPRTRDVTQQLSNAQARRIALAAQGFTDTPHKRATMRTLDRVIARTGVFQIDSVNVLQRAHYMPLFSRAGPYDPALLHRATSTHPRRLVEYWAHMAAYMPVDLWPYMHHRMMRAYTDAYSGPRTVQARRPDLVKRVLREVEQRGPVTARDLEDDTVRDRTEWGWSWNWSEVKQALEYLFFAGEVSVSDRTPAFERRYDIPERVLPREVLDAAVPPPEEAHRELIRRAAVSHGVATSRSLRDYYRMGPKETTAAIADLVEGGELIPVQVEGWSTVGYLHRDARVPRRVTAAALLSPFDPLIWHRERTEDLFGFRYRIEIYVPAAKRTHGYYVLPLLLGDRLVARVDLKADRASRVLRAPAAYAEPGAPDDTVDALAVQLRRLGAWLGLSGIDVGSRGDLSGPLRAALGS